MLTKKVFMDKNDPEFSLAIDVIAKTKFKLLQIIDWEQHRKDQGVGFHVVTLMLHNYFCPKSPNLCWI